MSDKTTFTKILMGFQGMTKTFTALIIALKPLIILFGKAKTDDSKM